MSEAFLKVVNMSISAGWLVLAVLALRLILKKAPKWVNVLLWGIVAVRLICPFSIESALSLIPSTETISPEIMMDWTPEISTGIEPLDQVVNPVISTSFAPQGMASANPLQILIPVAANLWLLGVLILLAYTVISYLTLRLKLRTAVILRDNIFQCETVSSPFVLGILKPRIYLPYAMDGKNLAHVVAHEQAHIKRKDHWWKPLGFLLLTVYWFNPLMWVAYILLCRDIELACDEKVITELDNEQRADYTQALVACAVNRRMIAACPLAFGEVGVKDRVKSILNYRKPAFWIIVTALVVCVVVAVCFLTDPNPSREFSMSGENVSNLNPEAIVERIMDIENIDNSGVYMNSMNFSLQVDSDFNWADSQAITYFFTKSKTTYKGQLRIFPHEEKHFLTEHSVDQEQQSIFLLRHYLEAIKYLPQDAIRQMAPADRYIIEHREEGRPSYYDRVITYSSDGVQPIDGWYIHLRIQPLHADGGAFSGTGEEVIELFYGSSNGKYSDHAEMWFDFTAAVEKIDYTDEMKCTKNEFPGITFKYTPYEIAASTSWENDDTAERTVLISGMPIWNAYFCDLTGDGLPEICSQVSYGSGIIDNRVIIYDYANGVSYSLIDRGYHDYYLRMNDADGYLYVDKYTYNSDELVSSGRLVFKNDTLQLEEESSNSQVYPNFSGNLNLGLNAEIIDIDYDQKILYVKDIDESAAVFGDRCAVDCSYAISRYNLCYVNYGDPNDVITIDFSTFMIGDDVIIGMYESEKKNSFNGSAVAEQLQLSTQRLSSEVAFEFNFAGNTSGGQKMELTEEKPYWCITVVNEGTNGINIDILGTIYMVDAGSTGHIYPDKAWEPGTYSVFIGTAGGIGMEGYAICSISAAPFQEEEPLAKKISSAERLSEHPLVAYISSEWAVDKKTENVELPFNHLLIKEDGSGSIDGVDVTWDICEKYTSKEGLHIELWDDNEYVVSVVYWRDSQLLQIVDQNDNLLECYYHRIAYATG